MISSFVGSEPQDVVKRWDRKSRRYVDVRRPQAVEQYNKHMGGVDLTDRMVAHYPHGIKSRKFYLRIIFHFLNVCLINAWILYRSAKKEHAIDGLHGLRCNHAYKIRRKRRKTWPNIPFAFSINVAFEKEENLAQDTHGNQD